MAAAKSDTSNSDKSEADIPEGHVQVKVTQKGAGKISTGVRVINELGTSHHDETHPYGAILVYPTEHAQRLEGQSFVVIL